jgi:hypothetical protein
MKAGKGPTAVPGKSLFLACSDKELHPRAVQKSDTPYLCSIMSLLQASCHLLLLDDKKTPVFLKRLRSRELGFPQLRTPVHETCILRSCS